MFVTVKFLFKRNFEIQIKASKRHKILSNAANREKAPINVVLTTCGEKVQMQSVNLIKTAILFTKYNLKFTIFTENSTKLFVSEQVNFLLNKR